MGNVWKTRYRLLLEQLEELADRLSADQPAPPAVIESNLVRLLAAAVLLLGQHRINKHGQCRFCGWTRWGWRFWRRRPQCTVYRVLFFVTDRGLDEVWWQLLDGVGRKQSLVAVRDWVAARYPVTGPATGDQLLRAHSGDDDPAGLARIRLPAGSPSRHYGPREISIQARLPRAALPVPARDEAGSTTPGDH